MDDELRRILGDADYEELSKKTPRISPSDLTPAQLEAIEHKMYDFGFSIAGTDAVDLMLAWACASKNGCEDCGFQLSEFLRMIVVEVSITMLNGVADE